MSAMLVRTLRPHLALRAASVSARFSTSASRTGGNKEDDWPVKLQIGKREVVGFGGNGEEVYYDDVHRPFPAIRFKEDVGDIATLREKEKGDWKKLTLEEKKQLYRASFCQTLVEVEAPTGEWKGVLGCGFVLIAFGIWSFLALKMFIYNDPPETMTDEERRKAQIQRIIDMRVNPIEGVTSNYDYEKNEWKWSK